MLRRTISGLCFYLLLGGLMAHAGQFLDAPQYTTGTNPQAVAVGDFNGDGIQDVAVVNTASNTVSVLLGNGDGTFKAKVDYTTGTSPYGIAAGDFNGDGALDLAVTDSSSNKVSIFINNGNGTFKAKVDYTTGTTPQGIAVGDFDQDGKLDLVVTDSGGLGKAGILIGNGNGTFKAEVEYSTGTSPISVVVADFNNDGYPDLAVANKNTLSIISVLLNKGGAAAGTFTQFQSSVVGTPVSITAGDFDHDGKIDLAVASLPISPSLQGTVTVLKGNGLGSFTILQTYDVGSSPGLSSSPTSVTTAQFTNSGFPDLVVTAGNDNTVNVLINNADSTGSFKNEVKYGTSVTPYSAVVGDFNGDGKSDIVVANSGAASISALLGNGDGTFQTRVDFPAGPNVNAVVVGDFNGDGVPDLAFADGDCSGCSANSISIILGNKDAQGNPTGTFGAQQTFATTTGSTDTNTYALVAADFDGDKKLDIAAVNNATGKIAILLGNGDGTFQMPVEYTVGTQPSGIVVGDFNGDGFPDLAVANYGSNNITVLINNQHGAFSTAFTYNVGHGPYAVARANFNADTYPDLVVVNEADKTVAILLNNADGTGSFNTTTTTYPTTLSSPSSVAIGDYNSDGKLDLAVGDSASANVAILLGNGDGSFNAAASYGTSVNVASLVAGDFDGDGKTDLALASSAKNMVGLLKGAGNGTFSTSAVLFPVGAQATPEAQSIAAGDLNGDGATDLVVANGLSSTVSVLLNTAGTTMTGSSSAGNPSYGTPVTLTANIAPSVAGAGALTGTITFENGTTAIGSPVTITNGTASITTSTLPVGAYSISAVYSGNFAPHTVLIAENVSQAGTTSALTPLSPANAGQSVTFTATVSSDTTGIPTGTVAFLDGATTLGTGTLNASGVATFTTLSLAAGTHSITASYGGNTNYTASVSPASNQVVNGPGFGLGASALSPGSVAAGASSTSTITITPAGGFDLTTVALSCTMTGPTTSKPPTCSFGTIASNGTSTLTVSTTAATTAMAEHHTSIFYAMWFLLPATVFGSVLLPRQKRSKLMMFAAVLFISAGCVFQSACGGGSPKTTPTNVPGTASGTYSITVTGSATGTTPQTAGPLTLTVQ